MPEQRRALVELLGRDFDFSALTEVDEAIRLEIVDNLPNEQIAQAVQELDSDDAVYILEDLDQEDQDEILAQLPFTERIRLRRSLDYPEETRRPAHADGIRRRAAVLDGRPDHRLHARGQESARPLQPDIRHRPDLQAARRDRSRPDPAHQARGEDRGGHARDEACHSGHDGPGRGGAGIRAVRPAVRRRRRRERAAGRRADHRRRGRRHPAGGRGRPAAHGRRRRRGTVGHGAGDVAVARALAAGQSGHRLHLALR